MRLAHHFGLHTEPIHDTMLAARRSGERAWSLRAQVQTHLGIQLDKREQRGDWGRRPLRPEQLRYAALDAACTLLLYEAQLGRGLRGRYQLRAHAQSVQTSLPLDDTAYFPADLEQRPATDSAEFLIDGLSGPARALLGIVTALAGRYSPDRLAASIGSERVGLAGWIIDSVLGPAAEFDEATAKLELVELCARGLVRLNASGRFAATEVGARLWQQLKPASC